MSTDIAAIVLPILSVIGWAYLGARIERRRAHQKASKVTGVVAGYVDCPDCDAILPIGLKPLRLEWQLGVQVAIAEVDLSDIWAHAWTHQEDQP